MTPMPVPIPRRRIDQVLAVIPAHPMAERLMFRLIVEAGLPPESVVNLTVDDIQIHGNQAYVRIQVGRTFRTMVLTDRALVHALADYAHTFCPGRFLFWEPHPKGAVPEPMKLQTLEERWKHYCALANVTIKLMVIVHQYQYARRRHHCPQEDLDQLRQKMQKKRQKVLRSHQAA